MSYIELYDEMYTEVVPHGWLRTWDCLVLINWHRRRWTNRHKRSIWISRKMYILNVDSVCNDDNRHYKSNTSILSKLSFQTNWNKLSTEDKLMCFFTMWWNSCQFTKFYKACWIFIVHARTGTLAKGCSLPGGYAVLEFESSTGKDYFGLILWEIYVISEKNSPAAHLFFLF